MNSGATIADLAAEQHALQDCLRALDPSDWLRPTPARGWDVRDTVAHLADVDEMAIATVVDGGGAPRALNAIAARAASPDDVTYQGVMRARRRSGADVLAWWEQSSALEREVLSTLDPNARVDWGIGMRASTLVIARLMETWAHGLDVRAAVEAPGADTDRLAHVAWLATRALPYAYSVVGRTAPPGALRVELILPSGARWAYGPEDADDRITGDAAEYCRVFVQRLPRAHAVTLEAQGSVAVAALEVARAYL
ncbi:MAG: maleylpyruvate isomerase family mycothiol-dependent enzyme [Acidimicrobiia bacterium]